jgi:hypothetical protein
MLSLRILLTNINPDNPKSKQPTHQTYPPLIILAWEEGIPCGIYLVTQYQEGKSSIRIVQVIGRNPRARSAIETHDREGDMSGYFAYSVQ